MDRFAKLRTDPFYRLMTLAATVVTVGLLVFCIVLVLLQQALIRVSGETVANAATNTAGRLDRVLFERMGDAEMMSRDFSGRTTDRSYLSAYLGWMNQAYPIYHWLAVLDSKGTVIATTEGEWQSQSRSSAEWFQRAWVSLTSSCSRRRRTPKRRARWPWDLLRSFAGSSRLCAI